MPEADSGNFCPAEFAASQHPTMPGYDLLVCIHQNGYVEAERLDTARDLTDLPRGMQARVLGIECQFVNPPIRYGDAVRRRNRLLQHTGNPSLSVRRWAAISARKPATLLNCTNSIGPDALFLAPQERGPAWPSATPGTTLPVFKGQRCQVPRPRGLGLAAGRVKLLPFRPN